MTIDQLMNFARSKNASDVHLTVGAPTSIRINGELKKFDGMDEEVVSRTILSMLSAEQEKRLGEERTSTFPSRRRTAGGRESTSTARTAESSRRRSVC